MSAGVMGTVYLLHFAEMVGDPDSKTGYAQHYTGWTSDLLARLAAHLAGRGGARLMEVVWLAGIGWELARTWPGTRDRERAIKRQGGASRRCPVCGIRPRSAVLPVPVPVPVPELAPAPRPAALPRVPAYERGSARARVVIGRQIEAEQPADRIEAVQAAMFRDYDAATARPDAREWHRGYQDAAAALIASLRHMPSRAGLAEAAV